MKRCFLLIFVMLIAFSFLAASCGDTPQPPKPPTAEELLALGEGFLLDRDYAQALAKFLAVIEIAPA
ncbi:MAG: hypothetical protein FWD39_01440, partial [Clostridiales bacterium]|nr:hypothetical protein [Clostridiales bacterium]